MRILLRLLLASTFVGQLWAAQQPIKSVQVTLRGKKYDVSDVTTVKDVQQRVKEVSGVAAEQSVLFGSKRLQPSDNLSAVGVTEGAQLNMIPSAGPKTKSKKKSSSTAAASPSAGAGAGAGDAASSDAMQDYLKEAGVDTDKLDELMKGMGGGDGKGMPSMKESMEMMQSMVKSPLFQEYMNDPEKLEQSRQMILNNPMLKSMMGSMPGMEELLNNPDAWREAMQAAASLYQNMDQEDLMKVLNNNAQGGVPGGGLFDGTLDQSTTAGLDELDEED